MAVTMISCSTGILDAQSMLQILHYSIEIVISAFPRKFHRQMVVFIQSRSLEVYTDNETISTTYCKRFKNSCYHHQCIANWTAVIMLQVLIGHTGDKRCEKIKYVKGCFGNDVVGRIIRNDMNQLDTRWWWWHVTSWVRHETLVTS